MKIRILAAAALVSASVMTLPTLAQTQTTIVANDQAQAAGAQQQVASETVRALTDIVMRDHVETLIEHNYWNATELYFAQRRDIDLTREQFDQLREEMLPAIPPYYDRVMPPIHNLVAALFNDEEASELTDIIADGGVPAALETPLGQRFASQALPVINQAMNSMVFDQVYAQLPTYRQAAINSAISLGFVSEDLAPDSEAEFDMSIQSVDEAAAE